MNATRFSHCLPALLSAVIANQALAAVLTITVSTIGFGPVTFFSGQAQESTATFFGAAPTEIDLTSGAPFVVPTHGVSFDAIGSNDGTCVGPTDMREIKTTYTISYQIGAETKTKTLALEQDATLFQICNNQFQFDLAPSAKGQLRLGRLGFLEIWAYPRLDQAQANSAGVGAIFQTRFLFRED